MILVSRVTAEELPPANVLEWSFIGVLVLMTAAVGIISLVVVTRLVEPRGLRVLLRRLVGKA